MTNGRVFSFGDINLGGAVNSIRSSTNPVQSDSFILMSTSNGLIKGEFDDEMFTDFASDPKARYVYTNKTFGIYFGDCNDSWGYAGNGNWGLSTNWDSTDCIPGINTGDTNDGAIFPDISGAPSAIQVLIANNNGNAPQPLNLFRLDFTAQDISYIIQQYDSSSIITMETNQPNFDPQMNVKKGSHFIYAPIIIGDNHNLEMYLTDGAKLTFGTITTLNCSNCPDDSDKQSLVLYQSTISNLGTGILENFGSLYPCNVIVYDGVLKNEGTIFPGKNVFIYGGTVENKAGAVLKPNTGVFLMTGGSLYNDQISELGSSTQNFTFTGGYILSPGEINANVYTQINPAILQLDIASKLEYGKILANNANVGGKLIVNALTGFNGQVGDVIPIIQSPSGRIGTFSYVDYLAFANDLIPILLYTSKGVDLTFAATLTPSIAGSFGQIGLISVNQGLHRLLQKSSNLHDEIYAIGKKRSRLEKEKSFSGHFSSDSKSIVASSDPVMKFISASNGALIREKQHQLAEKTSEEKRSGLSVYIGPVASTGYLNDQWSNK